ncbi:MAG TPA: cob(I)yrinic acid a,c-diamide adenosyltransferase [Puia sp.]|nr:cob(I)yrinic acid a,c-diamide adenosyltransferase [Puia sp.]
MASRIYTKTGDKGATSLIGGTKVPKSHLRIEAYGTVDELNSFIGLLGDHLAAATSPQQPAATSPQQPSASPQEPAATSPARPASTASPHLAASLFAEARHLLREIQDRLFTIGASLACDPEKEPKFAIPDLHESDLLLLEKAIDTMDAELPPMKSFVLPGGHPAVSTAHIARCVCRRAERGVVRLREEGGPVDPLVLQYLNRLSDYLFQLARFIGHRLAVPEIPWKPRV